MGILTIIGIILVGIGAFLIFSILAATAPRLAILRLRAKVPSRETLVKERLLLERIMRQTREWWRAGFGVRLQAFRKINDALQRLYRRLRIRAQEYRTAKPEAVPMVCANALEEARAAMAKGDYEHAEELLLGCLKIDAKHRDAYIGLSELYQLRNEHMLSEETLRFLRKLYPKDAEVAFLFTGILNQHGKHAQALREIEAALAVEPRNPKYLDFAIELAIVVQKASQAGRWLEQLREANPENQKLAEFGDRIAGIGQA